MSASGGSGTRLSAARIEEIEARVKQNIRNTGRPPHPESAYGRILELVSAWRVEASEVARLRTALTDAERQYGDIIKTLLNGMNKADLEWALPFVRNDLGSAADSILGVAALAESVPSPPPALPENEATKEAL